MFARWKASVPISRSFPRLRFDGAAPVAVAHALAFSLLAHCHYWMRPPTRVEWIVGQLALGSLLWLVGRTGVRVLADRVRAAGAGRLALAVGVGVSVWWQGAMANTLWVHAAALRPALEVILFAAHVVVAAVVFSLLVVAVAATDGPAPPSPPRPPAMRPWVAAGLFALAAIGVASWFVAREDVIYLADGMFYWTQAAEWGKLLRESPPRAWDAFRATLKTGGYTVLPAVPTGLAAAVFGDGRLIYVGTVAALYLTATYAAAAWFVRRTGPPDGRYPHALTALLLFTLPLAWVPIWQGFPDIGGVPMAVVTLWLMAGRPREHIRWPHLFGTAAILVAMILFRRWYSFWAVGLIAVTLADGFLAAVRPLLAREFKAAGQAVRPGVVLAGLFPVVMAAVSWPMMPGLLKGNYAQRLAGYRNPASLWDRLVLTASDIGVGYVLLSAAACLYLLFVRQTRRPVLFLLGVTAVMIPLFYRMQDPNRHHMYLAVPFVLLPPLMAGVRALGLMPRSLAVLAVAALVPPAAVNFLGTVDPDWRTTRERLAPVRTSAYSPPARRTDRAAFERLLHFLNAETGRTGKPFVVVSSSTDLHGSMFQSAERSLGVPFPAAALQLPTLEVDQVLGFPYTLFQADLVLVADPPQIHMRPEEQQTILLPYRLLRTREGIGASFEPLPDRFPLQNGVTATFYRRTRAIPEHDFRSFRELLRQAHPNNPLAFEPPLPMEELTKMP